MTRTGQTHTVEAALTAAVFIMFAITVAPDLVADDDPSPSIPQRIQGVLTALDTGGELRPAVRTSNLSGIAAAADRYLTGWEIGVSVLVVNVTGNTTTVDGSRSVSFRVNATGTEQHLLDLWFRDVEDPSVSVNGNTITSRSGSVTGVYEQHDITAETTDGANTLTIDVTGTGTVGYSIQRYRRLETRSFPTDETVYTATHFLAGSNMTLQPAEVTIGLWR